MKEKKVKDLREIRDFIMKRKKREIFSYLFDVSLKKREEGVDDIETGTVFMDLYVLLCMAVALVVVTNDFFLIFLVFFLSGNVCPLST